jgi:hypothetical protein
MTEDQLTFYMCLGLTVFMLAYLWFSIEYEKVVFSHSTVDRYEHPIRYWALIVLNCLATGFLVWFTFSLALKL